MSRLSEAPQAGASCPPVNPAYLPAALAMDACERRSLVPVASIEPVQGWMLLTDEPYRFTTGAAEFFAESPSGKVVHLDVSRWSGNFSPTQVHFAWLVRMGFPKRPGTGPWSNALIDLAMWAERQESAA